MRGRPTADHIPHKSLPFICIPIDTGRTGRGGDVSNNKSYHPHSEPNRNGYNDVSQDFHSSHTAYVTSPGAAAVTIAADAVLNCSSVRHFQLWSSPVSAVSC